MNIPNMPKPKGKSETFVLDYNNKTSREVYVTNKEIELPSSVIFSSTDLDGNIIKANEAFVTASGWEEKELIGLPHCVLRHPHMPAVAFYDMWNSLKEKGLWNGHVKNLSKCGGHYWVHAIVTTAKKEGEVVGYQSARHRISEDKKEKYEKIYSELRSYKTLDEQIKAFNELK